MENLAKRLIAAREAKGWKKSDLRRAARLKSPSTLTEIESGLRKESPQLPVIAAALGVEVLWLQHGIGPMKKETPLPEKVQPIPKRYHLAIEEMIELMEATDDAGKWKAVGAAKNELSSHRPIRKHRAN